MVLKLNCSIYKTKYISRLSISAQKINTKPKARDLNSIDTPNRRAFLVRQNSRDEEHSAVLGKGAFGVVLQATYRSEPVAVKLIKRGPDEDKLPNEQNIIQLQHENIIRIIKITKEVNYFLIIMERLNGNNLLYILNNTIEIPLLHQIRIILKVCKGLEFLHANRIIHLDVKPSNILMSPVAAATPLNLLVKLCDFGNSQRIKSANKAVTLKKLSGTVSFMAPEMLKKFSVSTACDVYALGITIWQVLNRKVPYSGINNEEQVIYQVVKNNLRPTTTTAEDPAIDSKPLKAHSWKLFKKSSSPPTLNAPSITPDSDSNYTTPLPTTDGLTWQNELLVSTEKDSSQIDWTQLFSVDRGGNNSIPLLPSIELQYEELYIKCWHRKPGQRPLISDIIGQLHDLLNQLLIASHG